MEMSKRMAIAKFFRMDGEGLKDVNEQVKQLTEQDINDIGPACIEALGATERK